MPFLNIIYMNSLEDIDVISGSGTRIISDNHSIKNALAKRDIVSCTLREVIPIYSADAFKAYEMAKDMVLDYVNVCRDVRYNDMSLRCGLLHHLHKDATFLACSETILNNKVDTTLVFDRFEFSHLALVDKAQDMRYDVNEIHPKNQDAYIGLSRYKNYLSDLKNRRLSGPLLRAALVATRTKISGGQSVGDLLDEVGKKMFKYKFARHGFFLSDDRKDALSIYRDIMKKIDQNLIITVDSTTETILSEYRLEYTSLFGNVIALEDALSHTSHGRNMEKNIVAAAKNGDVPLLCHHGTIHPAVLAGIYRTLSVEMVVDTVLANTYLKSCVVIPGSVLTGATTLVAPRHNVTTITMITVLLGNHAISSMFYPMDRICVYGSQGKDCLLNFGVEPDRIRVTGNPRYDYIESAKTECEPLSTVSPETDGWDGMILVATSDWRDGDDEWIARLVRFAKKVNSGVVVKLHPRYIRHPELMKPNIDLLKTRCKDKNYVILFDVPIGSLIPHASVVISDFSNVALEATLFGKPTINVNFWNEQMSNLQNFHKWGAGFYAEKYDELESRVHDILKNRDDIKINVKIIEMFNAYNDGKAAERVVDIITG